MSTMHERVRQADRPQKVTLIPIGETGM